MPYTKFVNFIGQHLPGTGMQADRQPHEIPWSRRSFTPASRPVTMGNGKITQRHHGRKGTKGQR
jgi:hypothetical protein